MSPLGMTVLLVSLIGFFAWTARRRWKLMMIGRPESRFDQIGKRIVLTLKYAIGQARMPRYRWSGFAHILIFVGFLVLLLRSLMLWGRGYSEDFSFWLFDPSQPLGAVYGFVKDTFLLLVIVGVAIFFYYRVIKRLPRLRLSFDGILILLIILVMMVADLAYDGARMARTGEFHGVEYAGFVVGKMIQSWSPAALRIVEHLGFWAHTSLVLIFLNILPYSKHFHVITAIPNVFTMDLTPLGRLKPIEDIEGKVEREETLGVAVIDNLDWKGILDLYTCTECGRCSDVCPATKTGKLLSPRCLSVKLRDHLYSRQDEVMKLPSPSASEGSGGDRLEPQPLVTEDLINPEVLWACTTCRACEEECPVFITYVDKIVDLRRNLVMEKSEFPSELQNAFRGMETSGNPWSYPAEDRLKWTEGLDIPLISDQPDAEFLFWVGCAPAFDAQARNATIATARLMKKAGVKFAILGLEETCTGDTARRAGNEFLYQMMAEQNCETLNGYNVKKIVTTCPHCFNTIKNEYPDFGGRYEVIHHTDLLADLIKQGRLQAGREIKATITYHDSCYLGRYNDVYNSPRRILKSIPGVTLVEPEATRDRGLCCGAGGAQMFKEEEHGDKRVNAERSEQLLRALDHSASQGSKMVGSACPFCTRMLTDGIADMEREDVEQLDVAEILCRSVMEESKRAAGFNPRGLTNVGNVS